MLWIPLSPSFEVMIFSVGTQHVLENHVWLGRSWSQASRGLFKYDNDVAGEVFDLEGDSRASSLSFLIVRKSGHLLPMVLHGHNVELLKKAHLCKDYKHFFLRCLKAVNDLRLSIFLIVLFRMSLRCL